MKALPCIICGQELVNLMEGLTNQANEANCFHSYGQYGSTVFDPMDGTHLEVNICDECLVVAAEGKRVYIGREKPAVRELSLWVPKTVD